MTTNQDILSFLKVDKEARDKERVQERASRLKEREEDMEKISEMIKVGVKTEVQAALKPMDDRLSEQEKVTEVMGSQIAKLLGEIETLRCDVRTGQEFPSLPQPVAGGIAGFGKMGEVYTPLGVGIGPKRAEAAYSDDKVLEICSRARRIIGFTPIEPRMLDIQRESYGARDTEEAMMMEIKSYLKCEMKVKPSDIEKIDIVKIFPPAKEDWDTLYVEFGSEFEVDKLFKYTRVINKADHRLVRWIPKELYERFRALDSFAYRLRMDIKSQGGKLKTRIKVGRDDLELSLKYPNSVWKSEPLPGGLPEVDLEVGSRSPLTSSPPPGRPGRSDQTTKNLLKKRPLSGSDNEDRAKKSREEIIGTMASASKDLREKVNMQEIRQVDKQSKQDDIEEECTSLDPGKFTGTEGYCPSTPAKTKTFHDFPVLAKSPIIQNKSKKQLQ